MKYGHAVQAKNELCDIGERQRNQYHSLPLKKELMVSR